MYLCRPVLGWVLYLFQHVLEGSQILEVYRNYNIYVYMYWYARPVLAGLGAIMYVRMFQKVPDSGGVQKLQPKCM